MTAFADELRHSEGERCTVTNLRDGKRYVGTVADASMIDREGKVWVRYDSGTLVSVGWSFVALHGDEKP